MLCGGIRNHHEKHSDTLYPYSLAGTRLGIIEQSDPSLAATSASQYLPLPITRAVGRPGRGQGKPSVPGFLSTKLQHVQVFRYFPKVDETSLIEIPRLSSSYSHTLGIALSTSRTCSRISVASTNHPYLPRLGKAPRKGRNSTARYKCKIRLGRHQVPDGDTSGSAALASLRLKRGRWPPPSQSSCKSPPPNKTVTSV